MHANNCQEQLINWMYDALENLQIFCIWSRLELEFKLNVAPFFGLMFNIVSFLQQSRWTTHPRVILGRTINKHK